MLSLTLHLAGPTDTRRWLRSAYRSLHAVPAGTKAAWAFLVPVAVLGVLAIAGQPAYGRYALLVLLLASATAGDLLWRRIFNWITVPAVLWAVGLAALAPSRFGMLPAGETLVGLGVGFGLLFALYLAFRGGEGDVKLMAAVGALVGWWHGIEAIAFGYLFAAGAAVLVLAGRTVRTRSWPSRQGVLPMAPFFAAGTLLTLRLAGH